MKRVVLLAGLGLLFATTPARVVDGAERGDRHLVVLGDPHIPGKNLAEKQAVVRAINTWDDVDGVVVIGDLCQDTGTAGEYAGVKDFFSQLRKPVEGSAPRAQWIDVIGMRSPAS